MVTCTCAVDLGLSYKQVDDMVRLVHQAPMANQFCSEHRKRVQLNPKSILMVVNEPVRVIAMGVCERTSALYQRFDHRNCHQSTVRSQTRCLDRIHASNSLQL